MSFNNLIIIKLSIDAEWLEPKSNVNHHKIETKESDESQTVDYAANVFQNDSEQISNNNSSTSENQHIQLLCDTMKKQIISRAFYGWLAYCRHLKTVRTHLADLVNSHIYQIDHPTDASHGISKEFWQQIQNENGQIELDKMEFYRFVYFGGIEHSIRPQVWLYLLEYYNFTDTNEDKKKLDLKMREKYEMIMSEWLAVEAIVRQRDKEIVAANLAKLSSESSNEMSLEKTGKLLVNEVFDDVIENESNPDSRRESEDRTKQDLEQPEEETKTNETVNNNSANTRKILVRHNKIESVNSISGVTNGIQNIFVTNPSVDRIIPNSVESVENTDDNDNQVKENTRLPVNSIESGGSQCVSPTSSNGGLYTVKLIGLNIICLPLVHFYSE